MSVLKMIQPEDLRVTSLGECQFPSPLRFDSPSHPSASHFLTDSHRIRLNVRVPEDCDNNAPATFEEAGPRERIFFNPNETTAAIVTCGGLSPGLNNVIRSVFYGLSESYGVRRVLGIRNGYLGLNPESGLEPITLSKEFVEPIDKLGGTCLGSSRGPQDPRVMADFLQSNEIDILFCLGGDGTQRGAYDLSQELRSRDSRISIVGIPKTIDNDVPFVRLSFGFTTALEKASEVVRSAHVEAKGAPNGIGLVKLMGRHAGFIAAGTSVVSQEVDFTLVPEIPFPLTGDNGLLDALERRMKQRGHAVIVVAEGAGQHLIHDSQQKRDRSGNLLHDDIGLFLRHEISQHFSDKGIPIALKYLDPSYHIRSVPADVYDRFLCDQMGRHAVHAAMAGKTGLIVGSEHGYYIHVPIPAVVSQTKRVDVTDDLWRAVLESTDQPRW
ncbi:MAG: ATP-dependent 6-phosphofructokinase [Planctomycetota bacterium]